MMSVLVSKALFSLSGFYFSERLLEGNCHVFMSKARFYLFVFQGA